MGGGEVLNTPPGHPVLDLYVGRQGPHNQVRFTVVAEDSLEEPVPYGFYLSHNPESVGLRRVTPKRASWLAIHVHHLGHIGV